MNGLSVVTHFITKLLLWLFGKLGINILLLIALMLEIPSMYTYYNEKIYEAQLYTNQSFQVTSEPELVHAIDLQAGSEFSNDDCYKVMIQIDNLYTKPSYRYPCFYSNDDDSIFCKLEPLDYYSDIDSYDILDTSTFFPAGTRVTLPYYVQSSPVEGTTLSFVHSEVFYGTLDSTHNDNMKNTLTITFP